MQKIIDYRKNEDKSMKNKIKDFLLIGALKTVIGATVFGAMCGACACAEYICGDCTEYTPINVMLIGDDVATDIDGNKYIVHTDKYEYGDVISITLNPHGKVVGVNGKCLFQTLE